MEMKIEVFSAGCHLCEETVELVNRLVGSGSEVTILDMKEKAVAERARKMGVRSIPSVAVNGKLAGCCTGDGVSEEVLRATLSV